MDEKKRSEAERVALSHQHQISNLQKHLGDLEKHHKELDDESKTQSAQLGKLEERLAQLYDSMGMDRPRQEEIDNVTVAPEFRLSESERESIRMAMPDLSLSINVPNVDEDWDRYIREVDAYIGENSIDLQRDPFEQLLRPDQVASVYRRFDEDFGSQRWDRWDYGAIGVTVLIGTLLDYFLVATPNSATFKGTKYKGSPVTAWMREQSNTIVSGEGNAFQRWLGKTVKAAEDYAKVPYDIENQSRLLEGEVAGLRPAMHRIMSPGHDPLLGIVFGVMDILRGNCTLIDRHGQWQVITADMRTGTASYANNPIQALMLVFSHFFSDMFSSAGLPAPGMTALQSFNFNTGVSVKEGGAPLQMPDLIRHMYGEGYDLRHFMTMGIVPMSAEVMIRTYHSLRTYRHSTESQGEEGIRGKMKLATMLTATHALLAGSNVVKMALYGWNPTAFNFTQSLALAKQLFSLFRLAKERDRLIEKHLTDGWERLLATAPGI